MDHHLDTRVLTAEGEGFEWHELEAVGIRTTSDGPFAEDVFWQFLTARGLFELPGACFDGASVGALQAALPDLDSAKIIDAMGSTRERVFRLWHVEEARVRWSDARFAARFVALTERLGGLPSRAPAAFERLREAWSASARRYHDLEHLTDCLRELDAVAGGAASRDVAELALWYHDAVHEPGGRDCEARSAALLVEEAAGLGISRALAEDAAACVRATAHDGATRVRATAHDGATGAGPTAELVADIDLSILGRDPLRFLEYEYSLAEEYAALPRLPFILARGRFFAGVLARPAIFRTAALRERYEARARANVEALLRSPRYRAHRWLGPVAARFGM